MDPHGHKRVLMADLLDALRAVPETTAQPMYPSTSRRQAGAEDVSVLIQLAERPLVLRVVIRKTLYPRDARQVLWQIRETAARSVRDADVASAVPLLAADVISPGAKALLHAERVGYFERGGSLYLPAPGAFVFVDKPPSKLARRAVRALFSGARAAVVHGLLMRPDDWRGVGDLATEVAASPSTVSTVLSELERRDWLAVRGAGPRKERRVSQAAAVLAAWATSLEPDPVTPMRRFFVPALKGDALAARLDAVCASHELDYAVTHDVAAQRYAPFLSTVSQVRVRLPLTAATTAALDELDARPVREGANLVVIPVTSPGDLLFRQRVDGVWLASPIQTYLDLVGSEGRAEAIAAHLRKERIGF